MSAPDRSWPPAWGAALTGGDVDRETLYLALEAAAWPREHRTRRCGGSHMYPLRRNGTMSRRIPGGDGAVSIR